MKTTSHLVKGLPYYLGGPYAKYDDPSKISAFLSWTGDKGFQLYKNLDWERTGYDKNKWEDVVKAFGEEFKPWQTVMQSWYQLGTFTVHIVRTKLNS